MRWVMVSFGVLWGLSFLFASSRWALPRSALRLSGVRVSVWCFREGHSLPAVFRGLGPFLLGRCCVGSSACCGFFCVDR